MNFASSWLFFFLLLLLLSFSVVVYSTDFNYGIRLSWVELAAAILLSLAECNFLITACIHSFILILTKPKAIGTSKSERARKARKKSTKHGSAGHGTARRHIFLGRVAAEIFYLSPAGGREWWEVRKSLLDFSTHFLINLQWTDGRTKERRIWIWIWTSTLRGGKKTRNGTWKLKAIFTLKKKCCVWTEPVAGLSIWVVI